MAEEFPDLSQVEAIEIENSWYGLHPHAPFRREYSLRRGEKSFSGSARFSEGGNPKTRREEVADVVIPLNKVQSFLKIIAALPLKEGKYEPKIEHTDDYPSISMKLSTKTESIVVFSRSQGKDNMPWGVEIRGKTFILESDSPWKAFDELKPSLERETPAATPEQNGISEISLVNGGGRTAYWYRIVLKSDGSAAYEGDVSPENRGDSKPTGGEMKGESVKYRGSIAIDRFRELARLIEDNDFFSIEEDNSLYLDIPQTTTVVVRSGVRKEVHNQMNRRGKKMTEIELAVNRAADLIEWEKQ